MSDKFTDIHPEATKIFNSQLKGNSISHAYLICGSEATMKNELASALARAIINSDTSINVGASIEGEVSSLTNPVNTSSLFDADLQIYSPNGARGYLSEQIREIISDAFRAPISSSKKVNILTHADQLTTATANAFLKTLEEPPSYVVNILLAESVDFVLPTIVSRCQVVTLNDIPRTAATEIVVERSGARIQDAEFALKVTHGNILLAAKVLQDQSMLDLLEFLKRTYVEISSAKVDKDTATSNVLGFGASAAAASVDFSHALTDWDILQKSVALQKFLDDHAKAFKNELDVKLNEQAEFLDGPAIKAAEKSVKRQVSAKQLWLLRFVTSVFCVLVEADLKLLVGVANQRKNQDAHQSVNQDALQSVNQDAHQNANLDTHKRENPHKKQKIEQNIKHKTKLMDDLFLLYEKLSYNISAKNFCDVLFLTIAS